MIHVFTTSQLLTLLSVAALFGAVFGLAIAAVISHLKD